MSYRSIEGRIFRTQRLRMTLGSLLTRFIALAPSRLLVCSLQFTVYSFDVYEKSSLTTYRLLLLPTAYCLPVALQFKGDFG